MGGERKEPRRNKDGGWGGRKRKPSGRREERHQRPFPTKHTTHTQNTYTHLPLLRLPGAFLHCLREEERPDFRRVVNGIHYLPEDVKDSLLGDAEQYRYIQI